MTFAFWAEKLKCDMNDLVNDLFKDRYDVLADYVFPHSLLPKWHPKKQMLNMEM